MIKAASAEHIGQYSKAQINKGIEFIRAMKMDADSRYLRLDVDLCLGAVRDANRSTAAHKALPAPEGKRMEKDEALSLFASMRNNLDIKPSEPQRIDTTDIESELKLRGKV